MIDHYLEALLACPDYSVVVLYSQLNNLHYLKKILFKIFFKVGICFSFKNINRSIFSSLSNGNFDILFISKGLYIGSNLITSIKKNYPSLKIVYFSNDNINLKHNTSISVRNYLKYVDLIVTMNIPSYKLNYSNVLYINKSYSPIHHFPVYLKKKYDILFIGTYEKDRYLSLLYITKLGLKVTVFGNDWDHIKSTKNLTIMYKSVVGKEYRECISSARITLCFLRKKNRDTQTSRSFEIPACGGFMIAERTIEHEKLFKENKNVELFSSNDELYRKCLHYLNHFKAHPVNPHKGLTKFQDYKNTYSAKLNLIFKYLYDDESSSKDIYK